MILLTSDITDSIVRSVSAGRKYTVLVVDKDQGLVDWIEEQLRHAGFDVVAAMNGMEALRALRSKRVHLAIIDALTLEADAFTRLIEMRKDPVKLRVLLMSEAGRQAEIVRVLPRAKKLRADATLPKPFTESELLEAIRLIMD